MPGDTSGPTIRTVHATEVTAVHLGVGIAQRVLAGGSRGDGSPLLLGITNVGAGRTSRLIEHDTPEIAYVLSGAGAMVTDTAEHPFRVGDSILIEAGCWHAIRAFDEPVEMLYVFPTAGPPPTREHPPQPA